MGLETYRKKRNFEKTPEPRGASRSARGPLHFVVQQHDARRMHYDFRLQIGEALKSWAVPKGPSTDPSERRLAVETEDHPLEYAEFEGVIPEAEYGAGPVLLWDRGYWFPEGDPEEGWRRGKLAFRLAGEKLRGRWRLVRMARRPGEKKDSWLLMKSRDSEARADGELVEERPESVLSGRDIGQIERDRDALWHSNRETGRKRPAPLLRPEAIEGARKGAMPKTAEPQLATLVQEPPAGDAWLHEMKLDGYRIVARLERGKVQLWTRKGLDWSSRYPSIVQAVKALGAKRQAILDGELVALDARGRSSFQALQNAQKSEALVYYAFDLLYLDGYDLRHAPLRARKDALRLLLAEVPPDTLRYSDHVVGSGEAFFAEACRAELEGIVSKRVEAPYRSGRGKSWLKIKCHKRQELVIVGFTEPSGSRTGLGALVVAAHDAGALRYAGKVGTGFSDATLRELRSRLSELAVAEPPVEAPLRPAERRRVHWVEPKLVAEVVFSEWTDEGILRHPSFVGLREDKPANEVTVERAVPLTRDAAPRSTHGRVDVAGVSLSHPDKILFPEQGVTKLALAEYYEAIAGAILPEIAGRPLTLLRCPEGRHKSCFFQKHANRSVPSAVPRVQVKPGEDYLMVDGLPALLTLVQLGVLELHVWGARTDRLDRPDRLVLDLDPGPGVSWQQVVVTAETLRQRLEDLGLGAFARLTGGKGLHVVVPIERRTGWDDAKRFTQALAQELVRHAPSHFTATMSKRRREGKIFVDYLRNARDATAICTYSVRARPGAPVATPVGWDELDPEADAPPIFGLDDVRRRVENGIDPWRGIDEAAARLTRSAMRALGL